MFDAKRQMSIIWSVEDVQTVRPDLDDEQAFKVLQHIKKHHDANIGISWETIEIAADILYPEEE